MDNLKKDNNNYTHSPKNQIHLKGSLTKVVYPKENQISYNDFKIAVFVCNEHKKNNEFAVDEKGNDLYGKEFTVKGNSIPTVRGLVYEFYGQWDNNPKYGRSFTVSTVNENVPQNQIGILTYLQSEAFPNVGPKTAQKIYDKFGDETLNIIDFHPDRLYEIKSIRKNILDSIIINAMESKNVRATIEILAPYGISAKISKKIAEKFKVNATKICKEHPYRLCEVKGIGFRTADDIATKLKLNFNSPERYAAAILEVLTENEVGGSLFSFSTSSNSCIKYVNLVYKVLELLRMQQEPEIIKDIEKVAKKMVENKKIMLIKNPYDKTVYVYKYYTYMAESGIAESIVKKISTTKPPRFNVDKEIQAMEKSTHITLAPEQKLAVREALSNKISIITGGPGTGKSTIINFILKIYKKNHPSSKTILAAPTGRAARRMNEVTNQEAYTLHKLMKINATDEDFVEAEQKIDADLVICDEWSMTDEFISNAFFSALPEKTSVVLVGDIDQLPSVGVGSVLKDMIDSAVIKTVRLNTVYRQGGNSSIPTNAKLIKQGYTELDYGSDFVLLQTSSYSDSLETIKNVYLNEVATCGLDNVMVLSPFKRQRNPENVTCVDALNKELHEIINPRKDSENSSEGRIEKEKNVIEVNGKIFRENDKVMHTNRNTEDVSNGDIGYISKINKIGEVSMVIDFGFNRIVTFHKKDFEFLEHAYAQTIHKSQGSEAKVVIINLLESHKIMLKRNLIYTAITRAKEKVIIVGELSALQHAIKSGFTNKDKRQTLLKERLQKAFQMK